MSESAAPPRPSLLRRVGSTVKGFLLWHYERGSWQYDVMVALILAFIFLMPSRYFHDQPVYGVQLQGDLVRLGSDSDGAHYRVSAKLLASYDDDPKRAAEQVLAANLGHPASITRIEEVRDPDGVVAWYDVWVRE